MSSVRAIRWLAASFAVLLLVSTLLSLGLFFNLLAPPPPVVPDTADLPTRVLAFGEFEQTTWPIVLLAQLLSVAAFGALVVMVSLLAAHGRRGIDRSVALGALASGAVLAATSGLLFVGAHDLAINVGYCDCGFKEEEVISRMWGLMLIDAGTEWLRDGATVLGGVGVAFAGRWLGGREMSGGWYTWSLLVGIAIALHLVAKNFLPDLEFGPLVFPTLMTATFVIWAAWIAASFKAHDARSA